MALLVCRKYASEPNRIVMIRDIESFPSVAIMSEDGTGLDAWLMTREDGALGVLYVRDACRRRGYGQALMQRLVTLQRASPLSNVRSFGSIIAADAELSDKLPLLIERQPFCNSARWNAASYALFPRLGFVHNGGANWLWVVRAR